MNPQNEEEARQFFNLVKKGIRNVKNVEVVICPPFIYIPTFQHSNILTIKIGAQDCFWEKKGAFTGEVSPQMLKNLGCQYVILGHSERRINLGETDEMVNKKLKAAIKVGLNPILCIGETENERKQGKTKSVLKMQLKKSLNRLTSQSLNRLNIAYEPVWAIGTGRACNVKSARETLLFLKEILNKILGAEISKKVRILYGGSVNSKNAKDYIEKAGFQGLLIGGVSLNPKEFIKILKTLL